MESFLELINNKDFVTLILTIMGFFLSLILGIASYLIGGNINIKPSINGLRDRVNFTMVSTRIKKIIDLKKKFINNNLLFIVYIVIVFSFLIIILSRFIFPDHYGLICFFVFILYLYIFIRFSWIILTLVKYNLEIDEIYHELMENNIENLEESNENKT